MAVQVSHRLPTKASSSELKRSDQDEEQIIHQLKTNVIRYARSSDKRMVFRSLKDTKMLRCISLEAAVNEDGPLFDLEKECAETRMILNGVEIKGVNFRVPNLKDSISSGIRNSSVPILKNLCREFSERDGVETSSREMYEKLVVRLANSSASADPYNRLNSLIGSPDLLVMPLDDDLGDMATSKEYGWDDGVDDTTRLNLYVSDGEIHMILKQTFKFGLVRKSDVKANRPWIIIRGVVTERANLSSNDSVRNLKVVIPEVHG